MARKYNNNDKVWRVKVSLGTRSKPIIDVVQSTIIDSAVCDLGSYTSWCYQLADLPTFMVQEDDLYTYKKDAVARAREIKRAVKESIITERRR